MPDPEIEYPEPGRSPLRAAVCKVLDRFKFLLPITLPFLLLLLAGGLFYFGLQFPNAVNDLRASYPRLYQPVLPNGEPWTESAQVRICTEQGAPLLCVGVTYLTDYRARFIWLTAILILVAAAIATATVSGWIIWRSLNDRRIWSGVIYLAVYLVLLSSNATYLYLTRDHVSAEWAPLNLERVAIQLILDPFEPLSDTFHDFAWMTHLVVNVLQAIVTAMLTVAAAATLAAPSNGEPLTPAFLMGQMRRGQVFLYTGCFFLTVTVLYTSAWVRWPVEVLPEGDLRNDLAAYSTVFVGVFGVLASLLLLACYLPVALIHDAQARRIAFDVLAASRPEGPSKNVSANTTDEAIRKFLDENRLRVPLLSQSQRIVAMLLPALTSPFLAGINALTSGS